MIYPDPDSTVLGWTVLITVFLFGYLFLMLSRRFWLELRAETIHRSIRDCAKFAERKSAKFTGSRMAQIIKDMETVIYHCKIQIYHQQEIDYPLINSRLNRLRRMINIWSYLSYSRVYDSFYLQDIARLESIGIGLVIEIDQRE